MKTVLFNQLSEDSKKTAKWEINQRNAVANFGGKSCKEDLTIENSLFYRNGVFAKRKVN